jgi:diguanylate cyclase (GGDEF)-like protein
LPTGTGVFAVAAAATAPALKIAPRLSAESIITTRALQTPPPRVVGSTRPSVIERVVSVVPVAIWIGLAASLAVAAINGAAALRAARRARRQATQIAAVSAVASTDVLTGLLNRRGFAEATEVELDRARRYGHPLALAYVDVRSLKAVNDTEGHRAGDELLQEIARLLVGATRAEDVVGRIGGDELALLLIEQTAAGAAIVTNRIRDGVPERRAALGFQAPWDLTIGVASFPEDGATADELLRTADRRLYEQRGISLR